jgi:hypothetical protein
MSIPLRGSYGYMGIGTLLAIIGIVKGAYAFKKIPDATYKSSLWYLFVSAFVILGGVWLYMARMQLPSPYYTSSGDSLGIKKPKKATPEIDRKYKPLMF